MTSNIAKEVSEIKLTYKPKKLNSRVPVTDSAAAASVLRKWFPEDTICAQEQFVVLYLNRNNEPIGAYRLAIGGITSVVADIRLILSVAVKSLAVSMIVAHNHPSSALKPSGSDKQTTRRIKQAAELLDIELLDHIILAEDGSFFSMADNACL